MTDQERVPSPDIPVGRKKDVALSPTFAEARKRDAAAITAMRSERVPSRIHKVNAYTWAGRRAECAVTSEFLPSVQGWDGVTCTDCLATREQVSPIPTEQERPLSPKHLCGPCDRGTLTAGHCVDIDGSYWHDCNATRQTDAGAAPERVPSCAGGCVLPDD